MCKRPAPTRLTFAAACLLCVSLCATPSRAETFVEDFSTSTYCDQAQTTAWWDTGSGELKLRPFELELLDTLPLGEEQGARDVVVAGDYAYVAVQEEALMVADIRDPADMRQVAFLPGLPAGFSLEIDGDILCAIGGGLVLIDVSHPETPVVRGMLDPLAEATNVCLRGGIAYVACGNLGLACVDIHDPDHPALLGICDLPYYAYDVDVRGDRAYVSELAQAIVVVDVSDPAAPTLVNQVATAYEPQHLTIAGDLLYVAETSSEVLIYSLGDLDTPALIGRCSLPGHVQDVAVDGVHAYATVTDNYHWGLYRLDVSDPTAPVLCERFEDGCCPLVVRLAGDHAFLANLWRGLQSFRIADSIVPQVEGVMDDIDPIGGFRIDGRLAYALKFGIDGYVFTVYSMADPTRPVEIGSCEVFGSTSGFEIDPPYAYVPCHDYMRVIDIHDPTQPQLAGYVETVGGSIHGIVPYGDYLLTGYSDGRTWLRTIDVHDPTHPVVVNDVQTAHFPRGFYRNGKYLYFVNWEDGELNETTRQFDVSIFDISDPVHPVEVGSFAVDDAYPEHLCGQGDVLYVSFWTFQSVHGNGFLAYDISDPTHPAFLARYEGGEGLGQAIAVGDLLFQAGGSRLDVFDVSDPSSPVLRHSLYMQQPEANGLLRSGDHLFTIGAYSGIGCVRVFDRSANLSQNPPDARPPFAVAQSLVLPAQEAPIARARIEAAGSAGIAWEFSADGGAHWQPLPASGEWAALAYPGDQPLWRATLQYADAGAPPCVKELRLEWSSTRTSDSPEPSATAFTLHAPVPNPTHAAVSFAFDLPAPGVAMLEIFDVDGRVLRVLECGPLPAGHHEAAWDGRDASGRPVSAGIYSCRLRAGEREQVQRVTVLE